MDKYELKETIREIDHLISHHRFKEAAEVADTVDWRKIRSVRVLCKISDLYKISRRYEDSKRVLELAYAKYPRGRQIIYSLCELELKLNNYVRALQLYNEYINVAPRDSDRYVLQYKLYKEQNVGIGERIAVLEELARIDYREKWAYELARLYVEADQPALCIAECDELIAFFGEGRYVRRALELKASLTELPREQREILERMTGSAGRKKASNGRGGQRETGAQENFVEEVSEEEATEEPAGETRSEEETSENPTLKSRGEEAPETAEEEAGTFRVEESEQGEGYKEVSDPTKVLPRVEPSGERQEAAYNRETTKEVPVKSVREYRDASLYREVASYVNAHEDTAFEVPPMEESPYSSETMQKTILKGLQDLDSYDPYLSQETDGQYAMVMEEPQGSEKQITGQLNLEEIMSEWEKVKRDFYETNGFDPEEPPVRAQRRAPAETQKDADESAAGTRSWDREEVHRALRIRDDEKDSTDFDTSLFVTEGGGEFPTEFAVEQSEEVEEQDGKGSGGILHRRGLSMFPEDSIRQLENAMELVRLDGGRGNVIITGDEGSGTLGLARELIRRFRRENPNFVGQIAKSEGQYITRENVASVIPRMPFGALIIEHAASMSGDGAAALCQMLEMSEHNILIVWIDRRGATDAFLSAHPRLAEMFPARIDIAALSVDTLLGYAREYAGKQQCDIDEYGINALESRVLSMQTIEHSVTLEDVRNIVDEAIYYAKRKSLSSLVDSFSRRRGTGSIRTVLRDKDFLHY